MEYYKDLLTNLEANIHDNNYISDNIIHPLTFYKICDHYLSDEYHPPGKNNLLDFNAITTVKNFDIIYVQSDLLCFFTNHILYNINKSIILITGKYGLPSVKKIPLTDNLLNNPKIILWFSQNPIYPNSSKYIGIPYGIKQASLDIYANALIRNKNSCKIKDILHLNNSITNKCREVLPRIPRLNLCDFYDRIAEAKYILSPIGDRDDCFRHYESIGLGAIPISNVSPDYRYIFGDNMYYADIMTMKYILDNDYIDHTYFLPNKNIICSKYHIDKVKSIINNKKKIIKENELSTLDNKINIDFSLSSFFKSRNIKITEGFVQNLIEQSNRLKNLFPKKYVSTIRVLEIGFNGGHSSELFLSLNNSIHVTSFDLGIHKYTKFGEQYIKQRFPSKHTMVYGNSIETIPKYILQYPNLKYNYIFIDGGHDYNTAKADLVNCRSFANKNTIVIMDDIVKDTTKQEKYNIGPTKAWSEEISNNKLIELGYDFYRNGRGMAWGLYIFIG
jgi:hypothetical protein